ncbi:polysaccharide deacetylase family protein [Thalassospira alkalitolerans]|uniref:polysaccharide deacetylase family protein n=1 Tax=Thalassospira alkalitolerans TaxID=1293890 RepID=UPI003AA884E8
MEVFKAGLKNPVNFGLHALSKVAPETVTQRFLSLCTQSGLKQPAFLLSFDCDTKKDIRVVRSVHQRLTDMGITPVYAVPGQLLEAGAEVYRGLADQGAEFINHGYFEHSHLSADETVYESSYFYDQLPLEKVREDILLGDKAVRDIIGKAPQGFRTPHFGTFQSKSDLIFLHRVLADLGYRFSTSTAPSAGIKWGPASRRFGLFEFPVTGCPDAPFRILDSWSFRFAPNRKLGEADYVSQANAMRTLLASGKPYLVNIYADPSQIHDWDDFFVAMEGMAPYNIKSYSKLLELFPPAPVRNHI